MNNSVILCPKRSGSTFLQEALNSHPQIICHDELFMTSKNIRKRRGQVLFKTKKSEEEMNVDQYIDWINKQNPKKSTLFRLIYLHEGKFNVLGVVTAKKKLPVIHLTRENLLQKEISRVSKGLEIGERVKLYFDTTISKMRKEQRNNDHYRERLEGYKNKIEIHYENMIGRVEGDKEEVKKYGAFNILSNQVTYLNEDVGRKICELLKVDYQPMYSNVSKRNPWNLEDIIENYDYIIKKLKKTEFAYLVE